METRKLRGLLRRSREGLKLSQEQAARLVRGGPDRNTIRRWETTGSLAQLRYGLGLARQDPTLTLRFLFEMDPNAERAWICMPRRYLKLENVRDVLGMKDVELYPPQKVERAAERADSESLDKVAAEPIATEIIATGARLGRFGAVVREAEQTLAAIDDVDRETAREVEEAGVGHEQRMRQMVESLRVRIEALPEGPFKEIIQRMGKPDDSTLPQNWQEKAGNDRTAGDRLLKGLQPRGKEIGR